MNKLKENFHLIVVVLLILLIIPIAYYFAYALPNFNKQKILVEKQGQEEEIRIKTDQAESEKAKQEAAEWEKINKESQLDSCLSDAEVVYHSNWAKACKSVADSNRESLKNCTADYCKTLYKVDDSNSCSLPSARADSVNEYLKNAKDECFRRYGS